MGGIFRRPADKVRFIVKDASNGRTFIISTNEPIKYTLDSLQEEIKAKIERKSDHFVIKYKKKIIETDKEPSESIVSALGISENGSNQLQELVLEYISSPSAVKSNVWTLYVKSVTGRIIEVETLNPQELCVLGLKLLIQEESGLRPEQMRLVFDNKVLDEGRVDNPTYIKNNPNLTNGSTINLVLKNS